jgi:alkyl hydroperoxide reductase subunit AhpC
MAPYLVDIAPNVVQQSSASEINIDARLGTNWGLLFSHPKDFTSVCEIELGATTKLKDEFTRRNVDVIVVLSLQDTGSVEENILEEIHRHRALSAYHAAASHEACQ